MRGVPTASAGWRWITFTVDGSCSGPLRVPLGFGRLPVGAGWRRIAERDSACDRSRSSATSPVARLRPFLAAATSLCLSSRDFHCLRRDVSILMVFVDARCSGAWCRMGCSGLHGCGYGYIGYWGRRAAEAAAARRKHRGGKCGSTHGRPIAGASSDCYGDGIA